jgi:hypothetical protein
VARHSASDIYAAARSAGLTVSQAVTATAIALAESSGDDQAVGDVNLQDGTWGISDGLWQIRTLKSQTGTGGIRDRNWLSGNVAHQAAAMVAISGHGTDWSPWTVYNTGAYQKYLGQAQAAAGATVPTADPTGLTGLTGDVSQVASQAVDSAGRLLLKLGAGGLGLVLLGVGLFYAVGGAQHVRDTRDSQARTRQALVGV